jgi:leucyl/phenylalanyl-tRNA--protein transferase
MAGCADRDEGTWITPALTDCYERLFEMGWAHSLEVWNTDSGQLVGGIYGLAIGSIFVAESMFHRETDASKVAFASLAETLRPSFELLDAETMKHLESLGCVDISRDEYLALLVRARKREVDFPDAPLAMPPTSKR